MNDARRSARVRSTPQPHAIDASGAAPALIAFGSEVCGHLDAALQREWLVTNGMGGFASGTLAGAATRRYHGLLVAALAPPLGRTLMLAGLDLTANYRGQRFELATHEYASGVVHPQGYRHLVSFHLDGSVPVWRYALADGVLEQRVWMVHGQNTTCVRLSWQRAQAGLGLELAPLVTYRDYHAHAHADLLLDSRDIECGIEISAGGTARVLRLACSGAAFRHDAAWYWNFLHRVERERGLDDSEDLWRPGRFTVELKPGQSVTFVASAESALPADPEATFTAERARTNSLLGRRFDAEPAWIRQLALAADQFIVRRGEGGQTVIAGYPWFGDWGRDTMIALPGLAIATGRLDTAAAILRTFAQHVSQGMLPNRFPDAGAEPEYNTVDATLWYVHAIQAFLDASGNEAFARELYPVIADIIDWHVRGTRHAIRVDASDGLLFAGEPGVQLSWMDAKVGDWVVTPRIGKPVEINALWHRALQVAGGIAARLGDRAAARRYRAMAKRVANSFRQRFWYAEGGYLYDVVDGPEGMAGVGGRTADPALRPNQLFAVSLPGDLLGPAQQRSIVDICALELYTPFGLRSLARSDRNYRGAYRGGPWERDGAYHQGTVWAWLLGPFVAAHYRVYRDAATARSFLDGIAAHLRDAGLGSVSEIFDGDQPHLPAGCPAQAWSVAEVLRVWFETDCES